MWVLLRLSRPFLEWLSCHLLQSKSFPSLLLLKAMTCILLVYGRSAPGSGHVVSCLCWDLQSGASLVMIDVWLLLMLDVWLLVMLDVWLL